MPRAIIGDTSRTKSYIPKVSKIPGFSPVLAQFYKPIKNHCIQEGQVVDQLYYKSNGIKRIFTNVRFNCLFEINEPIVPRFILDFYSQVKVQSDEYGYLLISFMIQHEFITLSLAQFGQILRIPYNGQTVVINEWDLASLAYSQETEGPYHTDLPTPDDIPRHSISSTSAHHNYGSSSHHGDDDEDDGASRASTPSPTTYLNFLRLLNYQRYDIPTSSQQDDDLLFERQTVLLNQFQQIHEEVRGGFKSFGKALREVFGKKKK
ncbi:hypothetical protein Tco_0316409 [Tanacetum coccineum]